MTRQALLDLYFMEARSKLLDVAAFLDRLEGGTGEADFRLEAFRRVLPLLTSAGPARTEAILLGLSDPSTAPREASPGGAAVGAFPPREA